MSKLIKLMSVSSIAIVLTTGASYAQEDFFNRDRVTGAGERYHEDFEPKPLRLGAFNATPRLELGVESNSNVYAREDVEDSDIIVKANPNLRLESNWSAHALSVDVGARHSEYTDIGSESNTELTSGLRGRIDVSRDFEINVNAGANNLFERRGTSGDVSFFAEPIEYSLIQAGAEAQWTRQRVRLSAGVQTTEYDYEDATLTAEGVDAGQPVDQDFRDHSFNVINARAAYAVSPDIALFVNAAAGQREFDQLGGDGLDRDADTLNVSVGSSFQLPQLIRGEVAVGFLQEDRADVNVEDIESVSVFADVQWLPTQLTTVSLGASRDTRDFGLLNITSALVTQVDLGVDHELKRNVLLNAHATVGVEEFSSNDLSASYNQDYYTVGARATYKMNPHAHFSAYVDFNSRETDSDSLGYTFDQTIVGVGVTLFP